MRQVLFSGSPMLLNSAVVEYNQLQGGGDWVAGELSTCQVIPSNGVLSRLFVEISRPPGVGDSYTFTVRVNGGATLLACTIAGNVATTCSNLVNTVPVAQGDYVTIESTFGGVPATSRCHWSVMFEGTTPGESIVMGGEPDTLNAGAIEYNKLAAGWKLWGGELTEIVPTAGVIRNLHVLLSASPGIGPDAYRFTLRLNGADTALTCTVTAPATSCSDVANSVAVVPWDLVSLKCEPLNGPANTPSAHWGVTFNPTIDGESLVLNVVSNALHQVNTEWNHVNHTTTNWGGPELTNVQVGQLCTMRKMYIRLSAAPGGAASYTFSFRQNLGPTVPALTVPIVGAAVQGSDLVNEPPLADGDLVDIQCVPAGAPGVVGSAKWSFVSYIPVVGIPGGNPNTGKLVAAGLI